MTLWPNGTTTIPRVTSEFGPRTPILTPEGWTGNFHYGIDLVGFATNRSPVDGVVILASYNGGAGNEVRIRADNGDVFRELHNASFLVSLGQRVTAGQPVGVQGTTGDSTGVHCHFECKPGGGAAVNPRAYMAAHLSTAGNGSTVIQEDDMASLKRIIFDQGDNTKPGFASTAIYNETTGFVKTSDGYGPRGALEAYTAIGGVLGFNVTEVHVNSDGWILAQLFSAPKGSAAAATVDIKALAKELAGTLGKDLADVTADEIADRLKA